MLEIFLFLICLGALAKRRPYSGRRYSLRKVRVSPLITLGTLGSQTVIAEDLAPAGAEAYRLVTARMTWVLSGPTADEGPVTVGYAHSDYTVTEIKECIEAQASIDRGDKIAMEKANRLVRIVGSFWLKGDAEALNDGMPIKTKLNWRIDTGDTCKVFAYNESGSALTTGCLVNTQGTVWIRDL